MPLRSNIGTNGSGATGTSMTVTKPTDCKPGDKIWAILASPNTGNPMSAPDGTWTQIESIQIFTPQPGTLEVWEKTALPGEPTSYTFTQTDNTHWATMCVAAWGAKITRYNNDSGTDVTGSTHATGTIATTDGNDLVLSFFSQDNTGSNGSWAPSLPTGLTMLGQIWGTGQHGLAGFVERRKTAGSSSHEVTQTTGGDNTRGSTWAIFAIHIDGGYLKLQDNFNRGDTTDPSSGSWPWVQTIHSGFPQSWDISSNELRNATSGFCSDFWDEKFAMDQEARFLISDMPSTGEVRIYARLNNPGVDATVTGYELAIDAGNAYIVRVDGTFARTTLAVTGATFLAGHRARIQCRGNLISAHQDSGSGWVHLGTVKDDTYIRGGYTGVMVANDTDVAIDDFWAGNLGGPIFPQKPVFDNFNRANGDPGAEWSTAFVASASKPTIDTNILKSGTGTTANSGMYWNVEEVPDGEFYFTVPTLPAGSTEEVFCTFRAMNTARNGPPPNGTSWSGYQLMYSDTFLILRKYDGTSATTMYTSWSLPFAAGDGMGVGFHGDEIRVYWKSGNKDWTRIGEVIVDATYSGGYLGIEFDDGVGRVDNVGGGKEPDFTDYALGIQLMEPTSYWRFSESSLNDVGPAKLQLEVVGSPIFGPSIIPAEEAAPNSAVYFPGSAALQLPNSASYGFADPSPDWTILWWQMITSTTFGSGFQRMVEKRDAGFDVRGWLYYGQGAGSTAFDVDPGAASPEGVGVPMNMSMNHVHMLGLTYEASTGTVFFYKDGIEVDDKSDFSFEADLFPANGERMTFGWDSGVTGSNWFIGWMDEIAIWEGTRLDAGTIADLYESGINLNLPRNNVFTSRRRTVQR